MISLSAFVYVEWWTRARRHRCFSLWVPLILLWLLLLPLLLVLFPFLALAGVFAGVNALRLYDAAWRLLAALGKTRVEVRSPAARVLVSVA